MGQPASGLSQHVGKTQMWSSDSSVYFTENGFGEYIFKLHFISRFLVCFLKGYFYYKNVNFFAPSILYNKLFFLQSKKWVSSHKRRYFTFNKQKNMVEKIKFKEEWDEVENKVIEFSLTTRKNYIEDLIWAETRCLKVGEVLVVLLRAVNGLTRNKRYLKGRDLVTKNYIPLFKKPFVNTNRKWF